MRYDGQIKYQASLIEYLQRYFTLIAICPEVEIGLGVPRPAVELTGSPSQPRMTGRDNAQLDISEKMQHYCQQKPAQLNDICGYIFKSRSPSCGLNDTPVFQHKKEVYRGAGLFTRAIQQHFTTLPLSDEKQLNTETARQQFKQRVLHYYQQQPNPYK